MDRQHDVIQGSRYDYDGGPFYWQYDFIVPLGIPNPIAPAAFGRPGYRVMDTLCFEGGLFRRNIVEQIGLPDPRFFIYWDDTMYGYRASKVTNPIVVPDVILRRTREIGNWDIAGVRQLNSTSDMNRYHIMRNRGYMARYFMAFGDYRPLMFGLGTLLTAAKEVIRLVMVDREHAKTGLVQIAKVGGILASCCMIRIGSRCRRSSNVAAPSSDGYFLMIRPMPMRCVGMGRIVCRKQSQIFAFHCDRLCNRIHQLCIVGAFWGMGRVTMAFTGSIYPLCTLIGEVEDD